MRYRIGKSNVGWLAAVGGLALALLAPPVLAQQPAPEKVRIVMDWILQGPQAIYLRAAESGCFASKGLDVTIDRGYGAGETLGTALVGPT